LQLLRNGVDIQDGKGLTAPADVVLLEKGTHTSLLSIAIHEGRNRQVRKMCGAIHHECLDLQRISFGPLTLDGIEEGTWKILDENEASAIKSAVQ
ncbi:MAG: rRNA pseudouridine synthase, partial [Eggerthellaceae bacterium]|nr:rRNA pseudouridine synthase [Eggerthellaceae bacterium]